MAGRDVLIIGITLFVVATTLFVINFVSSQLITNLVAAPAIAANSNATTALNAIQNKVVDRSDYLFLAVFIGLILSVIITSWFIAGNPIFTIAYIIIWLFGVVVSSLFSYIWDIITPASVFGATISKFPIANHIIGNLPLYIAVIGFIGIVVIYMKPMIFSGDPNF